MEISNEVNEENEENIIDLFNYYITKNNMFLITKEQHDEYIKLKEKINKISEYLDIEFINCLLYSEWTVGYNECINKHKSNLQNILKGDDINE